MQLEGRTRTKTGEPDSQEPQELIFPALLFHLPGCANKKTPARLQGRNPRARAAKGRALGIPEEEKGNYTEGDSPCW